MPTWPLALQSPSYLSALTNLRSPSGLLLLAPWVWSLRCEHHGYLGSGELRKVLAQDLVLTRAAPSPARMFRPFPRRHSWGNRQSEQEALGPFFLPPPPTLRFPSCTLGELW